MATAKNERIGIVGVGRMGLAMLKHLVKHGYQVTACDLDETQLAKAREAGAHMLSGAVLDLSALRDLIPDFKEKGAPLVAEVHDEDPKLRIGAHAVSFRPTPLARYPGLGSPSSRASARSRARSGSAAATAVSFPPWPTRYLVFGLSDVRAWRIAFAMTSGGARRTSSEPASSRAS